MITGQLDTPEVSLYYTIRGDGPVLLILQGGAGNADGSEDLLGIPQRHAAHQVDVMAHRLLPRRQRIATLLPEMMAVKQAAALAQTHRFGHRSGRAAKRMRSRC